jgi:hypothetical protein
MLLLPPRTLKKSADFHSNFQSTLRSARWIHSKTYVHAEKILKRPLAEKILKRPISVAVR